MSSRKPHPEDKTVRFELVNMQENNMFIEFETRNGKLHPSRKKAIRTIHIKDGVEEWVSVNHRDKNGNLVKWLEVEVNRCLAKLDVRKEQ